MDAGLRAAHAASQLDRQGEAEAGFLASSRPNAAHHRDRQRVVGREASVESAFECLSKM